MRSTRKQSWEAGPAFGLPSLPQCLRKSPSLAPPGFIEFWHGSSKIIQMPNTTTTARARDCVDMDVLLPRSWEFAHKSHF